MLLENQRHGNTSVTWLLPVSSAQDPILRLVTLSSFQFPEQVMFFGSTSLLLDASSPPPHATLSCIPEQEVRCDRDKSLENLAYDSFFPHGTSQTFHYNNSLSFRVFHTRL